MIWISLPKNENFHFLHGRERPKEIFVQYEQFWDIVINAKMSLFNENGEMGKIYKILWSFCLNLKSVGFEEAKKHSNLNLELFGWHFPRLLWFLVSRKIFLRPIWIFMCYFNRFPNRTSTIHHILFFEYSFVVFLINICHAILFNKFIFLVFSGLKILFDYWRLHTTPLMLLENFSRV